jgi:hypothetical protein
LPDRVKLRDESSRTDLTAHDRLPDGAKY